MNHAVWVVSYLDPFQDDAFLPVQVFGSLHVARQSVENDAAFQNVSLVWENRYADVAPDEPEEEIIWDAKVNDVLWYRVEPFAVRSEALLTLDGAHIRAGWETVVRAAVEVTA